MPFAKYNKTTNKLQQNQTTKKKEAVISALDVACPNCQSLHLQIIEHDSKLPLWKKIMI